MFFPRCATKAVREGAVFKVGGGCRQRVTVQALTPFDRIAPIGTGGTPINGNASEVSIGDAALPLRLSAVHPCSFSPLLIRIFTTAPSLTVTKMKKNLKYSMLSDTMCQTPDGLMEVRIQQVEFVKQVKGGEVIRHKSRIITYVDVKKRKLISLLTNDMESDPEEIIAIYRQRWEIELLFKQMKQNFPLKYFYGESANAIKIQIWITLIANLLLMVMQKGLKRQWSFSGLATMVRITLMYYVDFNSLFNNPEKEWEIILSEASGAPPEPSLFD